MKRLSVCMLFGCVCALGLGVLSCEAAEQKTRTLTDANGREVELNEDIQKAIVSNRYNLEIIRAVGAIDQVEAIDSLAYTNEAFCRNLLLMMSMEKAPEIWIMKKSFPIILIYLLYCRDSIRMKWLKNWVIITFLFLF